MTRETVIGATPAAAATSVIFTGAGGLAAPRDGSDTSASLVVGWLGPA
jgi:hypothetical protein